MKKVYRKLELAKKDLIGNLVYKIVVQHPSQSDSFDSVAYITDFEFCLEYAKSMKIDSNDLITITTIDIREVQ